MIQSDIIDLYRMDIKKAANLLLNFTLKRLVEICGMIIFFAGILLSIALFSYSPEDPNFIFPKDTEIKNLLGFQGSIISDLFFPIFWVYCLSNFFHLHNNWDQYI